MLIFSYNYVSDNINHLDLRSDIENGNINDTYLVFEGEITNSSDSEDIGTWCIDCTFPDGTLIDFYLYTSELEYNQDVELLLK